MAFLPNEPGCPWCGEMMLDTTGWGQKPDYLTWVCGSERRGTTYMQGGCDMGIRDALLDLSLAAMQCQGTNREPDAVQLTPKEAIIRDMMIAYREVRDK